MRTTLRRSASLSFSTSVMTTSERRRQKLTFLPWVAGLKNCRCKFFVVLKIKPGPISLCAASSIASARRNAVAGAQRRDGVHHNGEFIVGQCERYGAAR